MNIDYDDYVERYKKVREYFLSLIDELSTDQLNLIPPGFNNNIIWHMGHVVAAQQGVAYLKSGKSLIVSKDIFDEFKPGTKPEKFYSRDAVENIKSLFISTLDVFKEDLNSNSFESFVPFSTRYGVELKDIKMVTEFLLYHEGLHIGFANALKKIVLT